MKAYALTTRARVMDFMSLSSVTSAQGTLLDRLIDTATDFIENYCSRRFKKTSYTNEVYAIGRSNLINLNQYPVISTATFKLEYSSDGTTYTEIDSDDYIVDYNSGVVDVLTTPFTGFSWTHRYRVTYTAGYDFDNVTTFLSDTCADLEYIVWKLVSTAYDNKKANAGVESESIGDYSVTYSKNVFSSPEVLEILERYKQIEVGSTITPKNY